MTRTRAIVAMGLLLVGATGRAQENAATKELTAWNAEFTLDIVEVAPGVFTAIGYGGSTLSMIVGDGGVVMIDSGSSVDDATRAREAFRRISKAPVRGIVYTHGHRDHTMGGSVWVEAGAPAPEVWAHARFGVELGTFERVGLTINRVRLARQFGSALPRAKRINDGISPVNPTAGSAPTTPPATPPVLVPVPPTKFVQDRATIQIAGVALELVPNPGETEDQLYVWLPQKRVLFSGDNFYRTMPNLYAIRGTPYRDVRQWADAVGQLLTKDADALVGGHTRPIVGQQAVKEALTDYRDTIQFIYDKTIEGMNRGLTPDELVEYVQLPARLASKPFLQPYYGHPEWAVRSIFNGYLGWFDGNATDLFPLRPRQEAERIAALAGGPQRLMEALRVALDAGDHQWAAQLCDYLLALDPKSGEVKQLKARALEALGERSVNAPARNYYLTAAQELRATPAPAAAATAAPVAVPAAGAGTGVRHFPLESIAGLRPVNVTAEPATHLGRKSVRVSYIEDKETLERLNAMTREEQAKARAHTPRLVLLEGVELANGVIEAEFAGAPAPGAPAGARGFGGLAFRLQGDTPETYEVIYLRPANGRADDQARRNHATQYVAHPDWTWLRLRTESPSKYESYVDLEPGAWTKIKIEIAGARARLYVHDQPQPALIINDLESGPHGKGGVALFVDVGTVAHFRNVTVTPRFE